MKTFRNAILLAILTILFTLPGCKKDKDPQPPVISLKTGSGYTPDGAIVAVGGPLKFGITASATDANITNFVVKKIMPDGAVKVVLDSGLNSTGFTINETFYQGVEDQVRWTIQVMDKNRLFATTAITILKDPNSTWGGIWDYGKIVMGYQNNTTCGQFLIPATGKVFFADSAALDQSLIDIVVYYFNDDNTPSPTLSSPGELGGGITTYYPQLAQWTTLRYTKWDVSVDGDPIPASSFDACHNDSLLIVSYDDVWGKRKFKWADAGKIIPFMTASGKKGLIKVLSADHDPAGKIEFALKIQQ
ncbi:MAG: hypothetical protein M0P58_04770 [Bacteroidales bacterium]|nr:hypothetical protein [Bacteroidales bacterium]